MKRNLSKNLITVLVFLLAIFIAVTPVQASYNRYAATQYALTYALNPNPAYPYFSADCTNFASQVLLAGGWTETGKYKYYSNNAWYYDWSPRPGYSNTWAVANDLYKFLNTHSSRASPLSVSQPYSSKFKQGDIIQMDYHDANNNYVPDGKWDHTMIVVGVYAGDADELVLAAHSSNTVDARISELKAKYPQANFKGWKIK